MDNYKDTLGI